jgi:hypothetical protein
VTKWQARMCPLSSVVGLAALGLAIERALGQPCTDCVPDYSTPCNLHYNGQSWGGDPQTGCTQTHAWTIDSPPHGMKCQGQGYFTCVGQSNPGKMCGYVTIWSESPCSGEITGGENVYAHSCTTESNT